LKAAVSRTKKGQNKVLPYNLTP